jgi:superfamily II DNA or RNA helicase
MKLLTNSGSERVVDTLREKLTTTTSLSIATPDFSLFAFGELRKPLGQLQSVRLALPADADNSQLQLLGTASDRPQRNRLQTRWLARQCADWLEKKAQVRLTTGPLPQATLLTQDTAAAPPTQGLMGTCAFTTAGLGLTPSNQFGMLYASETTTEAEQLTHWFQQLWQSLPDGDAGRTALLSRLRELSTAQAPATAYHLILHQLFKELGEELDEERIIKAGTGIRNSAVWQKLYKFQRDAVVGAIDKLERYGGCILADSVGLGKTFEALAVIKYYELRNDRVLVLVPKRLRDNWTLYKANDRRNVLAPDRLHYDVLNHTDLSRESGQSGDIDLSYVNWGNYDLVVIDESHNFRNKKSPRQDGETRYDRLMRQIIQSGVKTRVLMLSATPVNNRLADLRNQIAFITENKDDAMSEYGIASIERTVRLAQGQFNQWLTLTDDDRTAPRLLDMLGFDYFQLLDRLTIARSRKHIEKYYGTSETGRFPERRKPLNIKADIDRSGQFPAIKAINDQIRLLKLAAYAPLRYVLPERRAYYDQQYSTRLKGDKGIFKQADREESLVQLMRVNLLKRMESSVSSFASTLERQLHTVTHLLDRLAALPAELDELLPDLEGLELDDPAAESLLVGKKVKVLLTDVDRIKWQEELTEDRNRLATLLAAAQAVTPARDAKLQHLRDLIADKVRQPLNPGNRKLIIFTAFADTAAYLYGELHEWALHELGLHAAMVNGSGRNRTNLPGLRADQTSILTAFAPRARERPQEMAGEGELELLIATDCISEGQNLQDCDQLINYDIHWNPVRIIQRFGRIDRLGSPNTSIQLVNFWPNIELNEYIDLEQRVSGRMVLLDISATGEENLIEVQAGNQMNDLEYRRQQLLQLQETVVDLEDLSNGLSIADLTLNDFRMDLAGVLRQPGAAERLERLPLGTLAVAAPPEPDPLLPPGTIFCLRAEAGPARTAPEPGYPLAPNYLVYVAEAPGPDGEPAVVLPYPQAKQILDRLKRLCVGRDLPDAGAVARLDAATRHGRDMDAVRGQLATAVAAINGRKQERSLVSLFQPGGTHVRRDEFAGLHDVEVLACVVILPTMQ